MTAQEQAEKLVAEWQVKWSAVNHGRALADLNAAITTALLSSRNEAIEECARVADRFAETSGSSITRSRYRNVAIGIRALKG